MNPAWGTSITAGVAALSGLAALYAWTTRRIVREELQPLRNDVEVLRLAVFNHLSHGERPTEAELRGRLGLPPR